MTLIIEIYDTKLQTSVYLADCLASTDDKNVHVSNFPVHFGADTGILTIGRELVSKARTRKDRIILCSGELRNIRNMTDEFVRIEDGDLAGFQKWMDFYRSERVANKTGEGFIYSLPANSEQVNSYSYAREFPFGDLTVICAGSGSELLERWCRGGGPSANANLDAHMLAADFLGALVRRDMMSDEPARRGFGGAYEIFYHGFDGFVRIPYTILELNVDSFTDIEGIHNVDMGTLRLGRIIEAIPMPRGTIFTVQTTEPNPHFHGFVAHEIDQNYVSEDEVVNMVSKTLNASRSPSFTMLIVRGSDLNFMFTNETLVSYDEAVCGKIPFSVDMGLVRKVLLQKF